METGEDAQPSAGVDSNVGSEFAPVPNLFCLMKLVREMQCEMEVVKPVLDELEVMRLCRGFGMMSSVNPKDFNFDILDAREFDEDFTRFLRYELLESSCPGDVKLKGLFGKQAQVSDALVSMKACCTETVASLTAANEGVYIKKMDAECSETQNNEDTCTGLVVFSWIRDELFEPEKLRDTPAFILRFLTGLAPDIICCTTREDLEQIKTSMVDSDEQEDDELSSYSVSFHIEKQEDQPDCTECVRMASVDLEALAGDCTGICLLKGSYPAIACTRTMQSAIRTEQVRQTFHSNMQLTFAAWLKEESQHYRIGLSGSIARCVKLCQNILKEFDMWPEDQVNALRCAHEKQQQEKYDEATKKLKDTIAKQRKMVDQVSGELFRLRPRETPSEESDSSLQAASAAYDAFRKWLTSFCTWPLDRKLELILDTPTRLRGIETALYELYSCGQDGQLSSLLEMCATSSKADLLKNINKRCKGKKQHLASGKKDEDGGEQTATWEAFLEKTAQPLNALRTKWWVAVESSLAAAAELKKLKCDKKRDNTEWYEREKVIMQNKLDELRKTLLSTDGLLLTVNAHTRGRGVVHCDGSREVHAASTAFLDIVKLDANDREGNLEHAARRQEALGRLMLRPDERHVAMFTVKVRSAVQVCAGKERITPSLCDYDARNRMMTCLSKDSVAIFKFDEAFKNMERIKEIDLGVRSTLTELPFTDILLQDSTVYVTDSSGFSQGIDIHNDQTSNVLSVHAGPETNAANSRMFELADNLAVGAVSFVPDDDGAFEGEVECISRDDHRHLPALPLGVKFLTDRGLGSFERTDQEDVFLSVLNASLSMFTIFRMEMRFDKDIDGLFTKFQKGINLLKNDERLFRGRLYMSVKDVNPNDRHGVLSEFQRKFHKLLTANREQNFLTEMYSGQLGINCSPPLGTSGYYDSLRHARQLIDKLVRGTESSRGFKSGSSFHDCIRLVLAKISILDWTAVDESSQRLEMNELHRKLPGAIRTGCLIPVDAQTKEENILQSLKDPLLCDESNMSLLDLEQLSRDYPGLVESWASVNQEVSLDEIDDEDVDFGPSVCAHLSTDSTSIHFALLNLFQRYLALTSKGALEKITDQDYASFDAMLSFLVCRRKAKVILWVKQFLGSERFMDEWEQIEQIHLLPFETLLKRCRHSSRHACQATREADGICTKLVQVSTSKFSGSCDSFDFELKEMVGIHNKCAIVLPPGTTNHDGVAHSCERVLPNGSTTVHGCGMKCAACEYYCDKPVGHEGEHSAAHGNMRNMYFIAHESDVIAWKDRKYAAGEKGVAEMCNMYCASAGRGHVHYLKCDQDRSAACVYTGLQDQRRHCKTELKPQPAHQVDEVLHEKYWKTIGWEDPCRSAAERSLFAKCPYLCDATEHKGEGKSPSYCDLDAWHSPAAAPPSSGRGGFAYINGHRFACSHASSTGDLHHIFVLDCSGSMRGKPWWTLLKGVRAYLRSRIRSGSTQDVVSVVTFGDKGTIEYECNSIIGAASRIIPFRGGGTFYSNGLSEANAIISRSDLSAHRPLLIFFTDGRPADRKKGLKMAQDIRQRYALSGLQSFVVGYGRTSDLGLADIAEQLGGSVHEALTTADLGETFRSISMSLGARAGLIQSTSAA
ncbi:hypothetical protein PF002_g4708 [Phytophthora fragariae]|uniref:VWFA domain-containing protein n=1 Tax=Phytophthora fragariae TaxID=53985 RepID=A0A6A4A8N2_9STRA|nr:hypothetical protein PF002_g4708 [Phytophthora fragariae]